MKFIFDPVNYGVVAIGKGRRLEEKKMKARLTLVYEKDSKDSGMRDSPEDNREELEAAVKYSGNRFSEYNEQLLFETFNIGLEDPKSAKIEFVED